MRIICLVKLCDPLLLRDHVLIDRPVRRAPSIREGKLPKGRSAGAASDDKPETHSTDRLPAVKRVDEQRGQKTELTAGGPNFRLKRTAQSI